MALNMEKKAASLELEAGLKVEINLVQAGPYNLLLKTDGAEDRVFVPRGPSVVISPQANTQSKKKA
jgi:hypothetical protein